MNKISFNKALSNAPIISTAIFIYADLSQVVRIFQVQSSLGHSLFGWFGVVLSLILYATFFKVKTPNEHVAFWCTVANLAVVLVLVGTVIAFR